MRNLKKIFKLATPVISLFLAITCQAIVFFVLGNILMPQKSDKPKKLQIKISSLKLKKNKNFSSETEIQQKKSKTQTKPLPSVSSKKAPKKLKIAKPPIIELPETKKTESKELQKKPQPIKQIVKKVVNQKHRKIEKKPTKPKENKKQSRPKVKQPEPTEAKNILEKIPAAKKTDNDHLKSFKSLYENLKKKHSKAAQTSLKVKEKESLQNNSSSTPSNSIANNLSTSERNWFLQKVSEILQKNKRYPTRARRKNITGKVIINFKINQKGEPFDIELGTKAHGLLIKAAERMLNRSNFPKPPSGWRTDFQISVPINFNLK